MIEPLLELDRKRISVAKATKTEDMFSTIVERARGRGMKVNGKNTAILCLSDTITFETVGGDSPNLVKPISSVIINVGMRWILSFK